MTAGMGPVGPGGDTMGISMTPLDFFAWLTDAHGLMALIAQNWPLATAIIAAVIFVETGLVLMPFLPGDSLLFTTGVFLGLAGVAPAVPLLAFIAAASLGDALNYSIGRSRLGQRLLNRRLVRTSHIAKAERYFAQFGCATIVMARFVPIVRTLAPFVAGLAHMPRHAFLRTNLVGAVLWCSTMVLGGYYLGDLAWVRANLPLVSLAIVALSVAPLLLKWLPRLRRGLATRQTHQT